MSLDINDIVTSTLSDLGFSGFRNVTSSWNTSSNTAYVQIDSTYFEGNYLSNLKIEISFDNNGYLDGYSLSGSVDGAGYSRKGLHLLSFSERNSIEAAYDQIEAREWAEEQALVEAAEAQNALDAAEALITQEKNVLRDSFDADHYIAKYSVFDGEYGNGNDFEAVLDHYVRWGKAVGRTYSKINETEVLITQEKNEIRDSFDTDYYIAKYSVFDGVYGNNNDFESVLDHYVRWGKAAGRSFFNEAELSLRDSFTGFPTYSTIIDGGSGIDTLNYSVSSDTVFFSENDASQLVIKNTSSDKSDTLVSMERIQFNDKAYALDIDGNAGITAKVIVSAFGAENLPSKMSSMLTIVDNGITTNELSNYIFSMGLIEDEIGSSTNGSFVDHVYENVVGTAPSSADHDMYTALLDNGTYTKSSLLALATNTTLTADIMTANLVDLIGVPGSADGEMLALQYDLGLG